MSRKSMSRSALENATESCIVKRYDAATSEENVKSFENYLTQLVDKQKLSLCDKSVIACIAQRQELAKLLSYTKLEEFVVSSCDVRAYDFRSHVYNLTVALYNSASQFANKKLANLFNVECAVNAKVHSATKTQAHRLLRLEFNELISKSLNSKKMQATVKALAQRAITK